MSKMPVVFVGHGSPMNIVENNSFTKSWQSLGKALPVPKAIICVSAHWFEKGEKVSSTLSPKTIYDFYGFPPQLYQLTYPAPGAPGLAGRLHSRSKGNIGLNHDRGLDHGAWSVLYHMYPKADIPVCQLSVNAGFSPFESYQAGQWLAALREEGVLILGSGNVVHNLALINWEMEGGYPWADAFDQYIINAVTKGQHEDVINFSSQDTAKKAFYYRDHFDPLLYALGATDKEEPVQVFNSERVLGSLSMTSFIIG